MENELKLIKVDTDKYILCLDSIGEKLQGLKEKGAFTTATNMNLENAGIKNVAVIPFAIKTERVQK